MTRPTELVRHYILKRVDGTVSPVTFWSLPEPPRVVDAATAAWYHDSRHGSPPYLVDYTAKLAYRLTGEHGIIVLNYGGRIGRQVNPEAASQIALALHDRAVLGGDSAAGAEFLRYARFLRDERDRRGRWLYRFDWGRSANPWYSALAQGRGASVMLRAWRLTGDDRFRDAASAACADFLTPIDAGGFQAVHPRSGTPYLEEYPFQPTAAINGFLATLLALYELDHWLGDPLARAALALYLDSLDALLPVYTLRWWTIYDVDPESPIVNVHSPRYHRLVTDYLRILAVLTGRPGVAQYRDRWAAMDRPPARALAAGLKLVKKLWHR